MWYLTVSAIVFCYWLGLFIADRSTPNTHIASWLILFVAPLFWPIVLPISIVELMTKSSGQETQDSSVDETAEVYYQNN
ncbi:conserved hypothetical protein [Hyella patelloides LEGE 07179]|uniref:Uncharacterized protein n=1 Tax=Hyella patelloides LEGE 07179 TaxID=945734 RepID=A0A563VNR3_9CYAN|nr:hypothetical protein [Hyella patelloides]VEP13059.1 conserved hypothetical protein [Hyella patelloides LEGE 07179]